MLGSVVPLTPPAAAIAFRLANTEGGADKVYEVHVIPEADRFHVNYRNGRRGSALQGGSKTSSGPVDYEAAAKIAAKLLKEKVKGGYVFTDTPAEACTFLSTEEDTGLRPMLLTAIEVDDPRIEAWITDDNYWFEEKMDGERRMIKKSLDGGIIASNRRGMRVAISNQLEQAISNLNGFFALDGEQVGEDFHVWDVLSNLGVDLTNRVDAPYQMRRVALANILPRGASPNIIPVRAAKTALEKRAHLARLRLDNAEGFVVKRQDAAYTPGRSPAGPYKVKFWASLSAVVAKVNDKRSVTVQLKDGDSDDWISVGNVTIPANHAVPAVGSVVEVRYLYAYEGGKLFEPTYLGQRTDIPVEECLASQRKFKAKAVA